MIGQAVYTIYSISGITAALYFPMIKHNATAWKLSISKVYSAFVGNLLYRVSDKIVPCVVLLKSFKKFDALIRK